MSPLPSNADNASYGLCVAFTGSQVLPIASFAFAFAFAFAAISNCNPSFSAHSPSSSSAALALALASDNSSTVARPLARSTRLLLFRSQVQLVATPLARSNSTPLARSLACWASNAQALACDLAKM